MDGEGQIGRRREEVELLLQQQGIGAEVDEALALDQLRHDAADVLVDQRLATRDRDHRRAAFLHRPDTILDGQALVQDGIRVVDLAAARTGQIAAKQRLQHQHQGVAALAREALLHDVGADAQLLDQGYGQGCLDYKGNGPTELGATACF